MASTIGFGADDAALELKQTLVEHLKEKGYEVQDYSALQGGGPES